MANGASGYVSFAGTNGYNLRVYYEQEYTASSGKSKVTLTKLGIQATQTYGYSTYPDGIIKINDTVACTLSDNYGVTNHVASQWYYMTISGSVTVTHASDGSASIKISLHPNSYDKFNLRSSGSLWGGVSGTKEAELTAVPAYDLTISVGDGSNVTVYRTYSPVGSTGNITAGTNKLWKNDKLKITFTPDNNYRIIGSTVNGSTFASGNTHTVKADVAISATAQPLSSSIGATDANIGSTTTITVTRYDTSYTHTVTYSFKNLSGTIVTKSTDNSIAWTVPEEFYAEIPDAKYGTCTLTCTTYNGSTVLGTSTCTFRATASSDTSAPIVTGVVEDINPATVALTGDPSCLIRYKSSAQCTISATAQNSATITAKSISGTTLADSNTIVYNEVSSTAFKFSATDSRKYTTLITVLPTSVVPYIKLTINPVLERPSPTTGEIMASFNGNYYNGSLGLYNNTLSVRFRYRESASFTFSEWSEIPPTGYTIASTTFYTSSPVSLGEEFDYQKPYVFEIEAYDGANGTVLSSTVATVQVQKGETIFDWGENDFAFHVPVSMSGNVISDLADPVDDNDAVSKSYLATYASDASNIATGTLPVSALPMVPLSNGGLGTSDVTEARATLGAQAQHITKTAKLTVAGWDSGTTQTVSVTGVTADNTVIVTHAPASFNNYRKFGVRCTGQAAGKLTFTCNVTPTAAITVNIIILN